MNHTPSVQGATGPHTFVYTASDASTGTVLGVVSTTGIRKHRLRHNASHRLVKWRLRFNNHTPGVQETTGPSIFAYTAIFSPLNPVPRNAQSLTACVRGFR